jgi:hypothetical protein
MKIAAHKVAAIGLALLLLSLPTWLSARERRGANLVVTLKDGQQIKGELIAVKPDSLLLLDSAGADQSVDLAGIRSVRIVRRSKALLGAACGLLAGLVGTAIFASGQEEPDDPLEAIGEGMEVAGAAVAYGGIGLGLGIGGGLLAGKDKTIQLEGKSESDRARALADLRGRARIRDYK